MRPLGFKAVVSRKKRKESVLAEGVDNRGIAAKALNSKSVNIKKKCLVEETSFDYGKSDALAGRDHNQTPMSLKVKTKKTLGKPLGKIDFSKSSDDNGVLSDAPLELPPPMKNLVNVPIRKLFVLNIGLDKEKLVVVRKLFSGINGFGEVSTPSKFSEIIRTTFTSKSSLIKAIDKAASVKILVNTNLKKSSRWSDQAVVIKKIPIETSAEAVHVALSEFGVFKAIKIQLIGLWQKAVADLVAAEWSILIGKDAVHVARTNSDKEA
ncbi:hypothetical protein G9A89_018175 [Geosiphon pyriformis]|nr:hypothetical protein G9A89_018175 [Geosiphon pyriformis]